MTDLICILESFNRKERYFLLCEALGLERGFALSENFQGSLNRALGIDVPRSAYVAMDYHLDWLAASLVLYKSGKPEGSFPNPEEPINDDPARLIRGNQEDVDLLVAFPCGSEKKYHIVMIEAKGYTGWDPKQLQSKARRLKHIFGDPRSKYKNVVPHFLTLSPSGPEKFPSVEKWPDWMSGGDEGNPIHLELLLAGSTRRKVERWNPDANKPDKRGSHIRVRRVRG